MPVVAARHIVAANGDDPAIHELAEIVVIVNALRARRRVAPLGSGPIAAPSPANAGDLVHA